jgi:hypothetical protein
MGTCVTRGSRLFTVRCNVLLIQAKTFWSFELVYIAYIVTDDDLLGRKGPGS